MQILRAGLGFTALQMFPEDKQDEISSFVFRVVTRGERSHRDVYLGTTDNFDKNSLLFRSGMGVLPDRPRPVSAGLLCHSGLSCILDYQRFKEVLL